MEIKIPCGVYVGLVGDDGVTVHLPNLFTKQLAGQLIRAILQEHFTLKTKTLPRIAASAVMSSFSRSIDPYHPLESQSLVHLGT